MYKFGRKTKPRKSKKSYFRELLITAVIAGGIAFAVYKYVILQPTTAAISNNSTPLVSNVKASGKITKINEPTFTLELPGTWKETERNNDAGAKTLKWDIVAKGGIGRWVRLYIDTIPADYPVNYVLPVTSEGDRVHAGPMSDQCVTFTPGAVKETQHDVSVPIDQAALPSTYQGVKFICDNTHVTYQRVGTSSPGGINSVTITGTKSGAHKYFFVYDDSYFHPDYNSFASIVESFKAK
jgi:hypothetical protein